MTLTRQDPTQWSRRSNTSPTCPTYISTVATKTAEEPMFFIVSLCGSTIAGEFGESDKPYVLCTSCYQLDCALTYTFGAAEASVRSLLFWINFQVEHANIYGIYNYSEFIMDLLFFIPEYFFHSFIRRRSLAWNILYTPLIWSLRSACRCG